MKQECSTQKQLASGKGGQISSWLSISLQWVPSKTNSIRTKQENYQLAQWKHQTRDEAFQINATVVWLHGSLSRACMSILIFPRKPHMHN